MSRSRVFFIAMVAFIGLIAITNTLFVVPMTQQALVLQFGAVQREIHAYDNPKSGAGLYAKVPFTQSVVFYDRRNQGLNLDSQTIIAADKELLAVDAYARWRIVDPLKFYSFLHSESYAEARIDTIMSSTLKRVLGDVVLDDIISRRREELMHQIRDQMNALARPWGVDIIDVRMRQADLPEEVAERVYTRMQTQREQVAAESRAEGDEAATKIRADADKQVTVLLATAKEQSEKIRGDGDAKRAAIFAAAYGKDPEFAAFYRSLQAYEKSMPKGTEMVIPPEGDFFRYMNNERGARK